MVDRPLTLGGPTVAVHNGLQNRLNRGPVSFGEEVVTKEYKPETVIQAVAAANHELSDRQVDTEAGEEDEAARYLNFLVFYFAIFKNYLYIFTRPFLTEGSSLQVEILSVCHSVILSFRHHFNISNIGPSNHPRIMSDPTYYILLERGGHQR